MTRYRPHRLRLFGRWRRTSALDRAGAIAIDTFGADGPLVPLDGDAVFTTAEDGELAKAHAAQRVVEADFNRTLRKELSRLAASAPELVKRVVVRLDRLERVGEASARLERAKARCSTIADRARHLPRWARLSLVLLLAVIDVVAYRAAILFVFDTDDEWYGVAESFLLALLSLGMVISAAHAADRLKAALQARAELDAATSNGHDAVRTSDQVLAELAWPRIGVPALIASALLLITGSILRVRAMSNQDWRLYIVVALFSAAAAVGAFFTEWKWGNDALDERDELERARRRTTHKLKRADRKAAAIEDRYRRDQNSIENLWSTFAPQWNVQMELAAARIAGARANHPKLFHPLSTSVIELVHARLDRASTRLDAATELERQGLTVTQVLARAEQEHTRRQNLIAAATTPQHGTATDAAEAELHQRRNGDRPAQQVEPAEVPS